MRITRSPTILCIFVFSLLAGACGGDGDEGGSAKADEISVQVASYDLVAGRPQRVIVGLVAGSAGLVGFGSVRLNFAYTGTSASSTPSQAGQASEATFRLVPGQKRPADTSGPRIVQPTEAVGVYAADNVRFDRPGKWLVGVEATVAGKEVKVATEFEVGTEPEVPVPGSPAPRTENHLPGAAGVPPKAVDSRADDSGAVPDRELHTQTVATAIASGKPTMLVISTPVYCQSRFCGPITDSVQRLAGQHGSRMNFVHLEVWRNFQGQEINKAAAEWIYRNPSQDIHEPWVFVISGDGTITDRFDNIASDEELDGAVARALA